MKHLALLFLAACATPPAPSERPTRVWDFSSRTLAQLAKVPAHSSSPKSQIQAMIAAQRDAILACHLTGTFETELLIEDGVLGSVVVTPDAPCLHDALAGADASLVTIDGATLAEMPLVLDSGYAAAP
ncbi:MAG: hypothetical protein JO257_28475 [Deltaproteobacteria bacterium]|nr:hypothetical protein [Deltaproteobacteria bacterium]